MDLNDARSCLVRVLSPTQRSYDRVSFRPHGNPEPFPTDCGPSRAFVRRPYQSRRGSTLMNAYCGAFLPAAPRIKLALFLRLVVVST